MLSDAPYFDELTVKGHRPKLALEIAVETVFFHCAKAFMRSGLWEPETWTPDALPSHAELKHALGQTGRTLEELIAYYSIGYADKLYRDT